MTMNTHKLTETIMQSLKVQTWASSIKNWILGYSRYRCMTETAKDVHRNLQELKESGILVDFEKPKVNYDDGRIECSIHPKDAIKSIQVNMVVERNEHS